MHQNDIFLFFKNYFWDQNIKTIQNIQKKFNFNKKKIKFFRKAICTTFPNQIKSDVFIDLFIYFLLVFLINAS